MTKAMRAWGNVYAIPLSKAEAATLGLKPGDLVDIDVSPHNGGIDLSDMPSWGLGSHRVDLDQALGDAALDDLKD